MAKAMVQIVWKRMRTKKSKAGDARASSGYFAFSRRAVWVSIEEVEVPKHVSFDTMYKDNIQYRYCEYLQHEYIYT
jgi:hypothetical protein